MNTKTINTLTTTKDTHPALLYLYSATSKDRTSRRVLSLFNVTNELVITSDGFKLATMQKHATPFADFEPGLYDVKDIRRKHGTYVVELVDDETFPDWKQVKPVESDLKFYDTEVILRTENLLPLVKDAPGGAFKLTISNNPESLVLFTCADSDGNISESYVMPGNSHHMEAKSNRPA